MKKDYTHILIVLDASGSMSSIQDDIKGSFNELLKKQREEPGKTVFDLYQFSDESKRIVNPPTSRSSTTTSWRSTSVPAARR